MGKPNVVYGKAIHGLLALCAVIAAGATLFIIVFIVARAAPLFSRYPFIKFITGTDWAPMATVPQYGILPFIAGSFLVTFGALFITVPMGLSCSILLTDLAKPAPARILRQAVSLLAGVPSVVYGFFGVVVLTPLVRLIGGNGYSALTGIIILSIMTLPTIVGVAEVAIRSVPEEYKAGSLALGATHWQTIIRVTLPAAKSGIITAVALGMGRAIGETMAVLMVIGNAPIMPKGLLSMTRTLTTNVVTEMGYAEGDHLRALFATGMVLLAFVLILNLAITFFSRTKSVKRKDR